MCEGRGSVGRCVRGEKGSVGRCVRGKGECLHALMHTILN